MGEDVEYGGPAHPITHVHGELLLGEGVPLIRYLAGHLDHGGHDRDIHIRDLVYHPPDPDHPVRVLIGPFVNLPRRTADHSLAGGVYGADSIPWGGPVSPYHLVVVLRLLRMGLALGLGDYGGIAEESLYAAGHDVLYQRVRQPYLDVRLGLGVLVVLLLAVLVPAPAEQFKFGGIEIGGGLELLYYAFG